MKQKLFFLVIFLLISCKENPQSIAQATNKTNPTQNDKQDSLYISSIKYSGLDQLGSQCKVFVGYHEEHDEYIVLTEGESQDGHNPEFAAGKMYFWSQNNNSYSTSPNSDTDTPTIFAYEFVDSQNENFDPNLVKTYIKDKKLHTMYKLVFKNLSKIAPGNIDKKFKEIILTKNTSTDALSTISSITELQSASLHGTHYHFPSCQNLKFQSIEDVTFEHNDEDEHQH